MARFYGGKIGFCLQASLLALFGLGLILLRLLGRFLRLLLLLAAGQLTFSGGLAGRLIRRWWCGQFARVGLTFCRWSVAIVNLAAGVFP